MNKEENVMDYVSRHPGGVLASELVDNLGFSRDYVYTCLTRLESKGLVEHKGAKPYTYYPILSDTQHSNIQTTEGRIELKCGDSDSDTSKRIKELCAELKRLGVYWEKMYYVQNIEYQKI